MARGRTSTTEPWLAGTGYQGRTILAVTGAGRGRATRDVALKGGVKRVPVPILQDLILVEKGYEPKYSGLTLAEVEKLRTG